MKLLRWTPISGLLAGAALLALPATLTAQEMNQRPTGFVDIEALAGVGLPASDLTEFVDPGVHLGIGLGRWINDWAALRIEFGWSALGGKDAEPENDLDATPGLDLYTLDVGVEFDLMDRLDPDKYWTLRLQGGVGYTFFETEDLGQVPEVDEISDAYSNAFAGLVVGRQITDRLHVSLQSRAYYTNLNESDMAPLELLRPGNDLSRSFHFPVVLGARWEVGAGGG